MHSSAKKLLLLAGDGIGQEIIKPAEKILKLLIAHGLACQLEWADVGGSAYDKTGTPLPEQTLDKAKQAEAILFGAIGGPQWQQLDYSLRPERALLRLRKELDLFANLRPAICYPQLAQASSLKADRVKGLDILIVRELTAGIYFGQPRGLFINQQGLREGLNSYRYDEAQIKRIAKVAFEASQQRSRKLCSVDKANVLEVTELWREVFNEVAQDYPDVELRHLYVDNAAMQLVSNPKQFDVIVSANMFGDILSDIAAMLTGSIGMLPSASLNAKQQGLYEPVHGSAPDIAGKNQANPIAILLSLAMLLRLSFDQPSLAECLEAAIKQTLSDNLATTDIAKADSTVLGTQQMGEAISQRLEPLLRELS